MVINLTVWGLCTNYKDSIVKVGRPSPIYGSLEVGTSAGVRYMVDLDPNHHKPLGSGGKLILES